MIISYDTLAIFPLSNCAIQLFYDNITSPPSTERTPQFSTVTQRAFANLFVDGINYECVVSMAIYVKRGRCVSYPLPRIWDVMLLP